MQRIKLGSNGTTVPFTATPTFSCALFSFFEITLTGNVEEPIFQGQALRQVIHLSIIQDATGGRTWSWPSSFVHPPTIAIGANAVTECSFFWDGTNWRNFSATEDSFAEPGPAAIAAAPIRISQEDSGSGATMPNEIKAEPPLTTPSPSPTPSQPQDRGIGHVSMSEEMDSARWTLPPIVPILVGLAAVAIVVGIVSFVFRAKPTASGSIEKVIAAQQEGNVLVAIHVKFNNLTDEMLHIKGLTADLETADGQKHTDVAAAAADIDRYFQAFPELGEGRTTPLREELTIPKSTSQSGMAIFSYPVDKAGFDKRKSLTMKIDFYDHAPIILREQ